MKAFMNVLSALLIFLTISQPVWAVGAPGYIEECKVAAIGKLESMAYSQVAILIYDSVEMFALDARWYNPSKYVWFQAKAVNLQGEIRLEVLTHKSFLPPGGCF